MSNDKDYAALKEQAIALRVAGYSLRQIGDQLGLKSGVISRWVKGIEFSEYNQESLAAQRAHHKDEERTEALELRRNGWSYNMIIEKLGVSKSTLSLWLRDVEIEDPSVIQQRQEHGLRRSKQTQSAQKKARIREVQELAVRDIHAMFDSEMTDRELFIAGLMLYWGEGAKTLNTLKFANSDPVMIRLFITWMQKCFNVTIDQLRFTVHGYPDTDIAECEAYWSKKTGIPLEQTYKAQVDRRTNKDLTKKGKLRYATCHITVTGMGVTYLHRYILELIKQFKLHLVAGVA